MSARRSGLTIEDIAAIGTANFESVLRQNVSMVLSDELDDQMINGDGSSDDLTGIFERLTDPSAPAAAVETWTRFLAIQSGGIDGLWATELEHIAMVVGCRFLSALRRNIPREPTPRNRAASYLKRMGAGYWTNSRMPATAAHIQQGILCRKGPAGDADSGVSPTWGSLSIDDIHTGARKGERYFTVSAIVGDVILVQPEQRTNRWRFRVSCLRAMTALPKSASGREFRISGRTLSGIVLRYGDTATVPLPDGRVVRERFVAGAFAPVPDVPLVMQHDDSLVIAKPGGYVLNDTPRAMTIRAELRADSAALALTKAGALSGYSFRFWPKEERYEAGRADRLGRPARPHWPR